MSKRKVSLSGIKHIKQFEGLRMNAYLDGDGLWNIGYGSLYLGDGNRTKEGDRLKSRKQADDILAYNIALCESIIDQVAPIIPLTQNMFDALVSYVHSKGPYIFLYSKVRELLSSYKVDDNLKLYRNDIAFEISADHQCRKTANSKTKHQIVSRRIREKQVFLM
ncbi:MULTISPECIES: lysozyme [Olivibacter]|uniref:Lysozyme n=1 Tax=Olivibacter jilunii TaxID=985016 RepID=A0ABW6B005_9SPHI